MSVQVGQLPEPPASLRDLPVGKGGLGATTGDLGVDSEVGAGFTVAAFHSDPPFLCLVNYTQISLCIKNDY
jgi:hypothetical protein